jgi:hypothetical protein
MPARRWQRVDHTQVRDGRQLPARVHIEPFGHDRKRVRLNPTPRAEGSTRECRANVDDREDLRVFLKSTR